MANNGNGRAGGHDIIDRLADLDSQYWEARKQREDFEIRATYASGETSRMNPVPRGIDPLGTDADYHYRTERNYFLHVERGRAAVRNHPLVEQGINRLIANLRLDDFTLDVDSGDEQLDKDLQADWETWAGETQAGRNLCDYEGSRSFQQIARQSFFNRVVDGDICHLPTNEGTVQTWESHHIRSPWGFARQYASDQNGLVHGAEVVNGRTVAYWITPFNLPATASLTRRGQARRFPVFDKNGNKITFWLGFRHRFFQRRGISRLSSPRDAMNGFEDLNYANIKSSLRRALISYLMKSSTPNMPGIGGGQLPKAGDRYTKQIGLGLETVVFEQLGEPAQAFKPPDGYTLEGWNANLPPASWFEHSALLLTMLAVNLDLPLSFLLLDGSLVNFHGGRMTFDQVKLRLQQLQRDEIQGLWNPTYEWRLRLKLTPGSRFFDPVLAEAVERSKADPFRYTFRPHGWPYVKPAEDVAAEDQAERRNLKPRRQILADRGVDIDDADTIIIRDRSRALQKAMEEAKSLATKHPELGDDVGALARELWYGGQQDTGGNQAGEIASNEEKQARTEEAASAK